MAAAPADAIDIAFLVAGAIESVGGAYFVGGSVASSSQGEPRATNDIDIVLELTLGRIDAFVRALGPSFEVDVDMLRDALLHGRTCNIFYLPLLTKVDLFAVGQSAFDEVEFARRKPVAVRATGETLEQWRDIVEVLRVSGPSMDDAYLTSWGRRLGVFELRSDSGDACRRAPRGSCRADLRVEADGFPLDAYDGSALRLIVVASIRSIHPPHGPPQHEGEDGAEGEERGDGQDDGDEKHDAADAERASGRARADELRAGVGLRDLEEREASPAMASAIRPKREVARLARHSTCLA